MTPRPAVCTPPPGAAENETYTPTRRPDAGARRQPEPPRFLRAVPPGELSVRRSAVRRRLRRDPVVFPPRAARRSSPPATRTATYSSSGRRSRRRWDAPSDARAEPGERLARQRRLGGVPAYWPAGRSSSSPTPVRPARHRGRGDRSAVQPDCTLAVSWSHPLGGNGQQNSTPTVADGVVFVDEGDGGRVFAYDARTARRSGTAVRRPPVPPSPLRRSPPAHCTSGHGTGRGRPMRAPSVHSHRAAADPRRCSETRASSHRSTLTRTASPRRSGDGLDQRYAQLTHHLSRRRIDGIEDNRRSLFSVGRAPGYADRERLADLALGWLLEQRRDDHHADHSRNHVLDRIAFHR